MPGEALGFYSAYSAGPWRVLSRKMLCFVLHFLSVLLGAGWRMVRETPLGNLRGYPGERPGMGTRAVSRRQ